MPFQRFATPEDVRAMPNDGNRYETVYGELLVTPAPSGKHQHVVRNLLVLIHNYLSAHGVSGILASPADIQIGPDILVQPDLFVADLIPFEQSWKWSDITTLHLVIEVLSPSTAHSDRTIKRRLFQEQLIPQYWIVDIEQRQIEVWTPDAHFPRIEREHLTWQHPELQQSCMIDVARLLALD